jgi:hypothetical protein
MLERRTFQVVVVRRDRPAPFSSNPKLDKSVTYTGDATNVGF